ncbi:hypothetical protein [Parafrigoribacterium humi]|jgi:hypothetical protein|uniref:hypothetical protein n=1 Tax=Parafrigoribacterium humi TaxID=3144664 RepID=UPI0032ECCC71
MELLFVTLGGVVIAGGLRYVLPRRHSYGVLLLPALGGAVAAIAWAALTWLGWKFDGGWIWVVSLVLPAVVAIAVTLVLGRRRTASDERMLESLSKA